MKITSLLGAMAIALLSTASYAQEFEGMEYASDGYNHFSLRPIHDAAISYRKTIWYRISLKEKQNQAFMAKNNEISKLIVEAAKMGIIRPFQNDSLRTRMSGQEFADRLRIPSEDASMDRDFLDDFESEDDWITEGDETSSETALAAHEYLPKDLYLMQIRTDVVYDKKRSRMLHDILSVTLLIPADKTPTGIEKELATFSYKELVENLFKENGDAIWYNSHNERTKINLADAFDLHLFDGKIIKYSNAQDEQIVDIYGEGKQALLASQNYSYWLNEYENTLWEN